MGTRHQLTLVNKSSHQAKSIESIKYLLTIDGMPIAFSNEYKERYMVNTAEWSGYQVQERPIGDFGKYLSHEELTEKTRHAKRMTPLGVAVTVKNTDGSETEINFSNYYKKMSYDYQLAFVTDDGAQVFNRALRHYATEGREIVDAYDPNQFVTIVDDFDGDGDEDIMIAAVTDGRWDFERVDLMTFENDGTGQFARVGFDPTKNDWSISSARCFGGSCKINDEEVAANISGLRIYQTVAREYEVYFRNDEGMTESNKFSVHEGSVQMDEESRKMEIGFIEGEYFANYGA
jgi:hypothetical protein